MLAHYQYTRHRTMYIRFTQHHNERSRRSARSSDHRPAYLTLEARTVQASTLPRWNYKQANWPLHRHRTIILTNNIQVYDRDMNIVIKEFNNFVLQAAKEIIPKDARKDYKPYWNGDLNNKHIELTTARNLADVAPSIENNTALKQTNVH